MPARHSKSSMTNEAAKTPRRGRDGRAFVLLGGLALLVGLAFASGRLAIEDRWLPWTVLDLADPPNAWTALKLDRLDDDASACRTALDGSGWRFAAVRDRETGPGCGFRAAVRIDAGDAGLASSVVLSCRAAVALAGWQRHALRPLAREHFGVDVARLEHAGGYVCRNVNHQREGRRSRHATADAIDVTGIVLADGRHLSVARDWTGDGANAHFLRALHRGACRWFDGAIGPDYNAAHRDHFHFDRGGPGFCR